MATKYPRQKRDNTTYQVKRQKMMKMKARWEKVKPGPQKLAAFHDYRVAQEDLNAYMDATR